jgi:hypothetical protein
MTGKKLSRKVFINKTATGLIGAAAGSFFIDTESIHAKGHGVYQPQSGMLSAEIFNEKAVKSLPLEEPYAYHKFLSEEFKHFPRRDPGIMAGKNDLSLAEGSWQIIWKNGSASYLENAVYDFQDYMDKSMSVKVEVSRKDSLKEWRKLRNCIIAGTREDLPGCGLSLNKPKDYEIKVVKDKVIVCGFDDRGAMHGLFNLEKRMNLREAPLLPANLNTVRHSLYDVRLVHSWMGWMDWPDALLANMAHDGFDGIYASAMTNPNGDRTTAENSTDFYARILFRIRKINPKDMHDLIRRANKYGIKVYTPVIYQFMGTPESEEGLRKLIRDIIKEFPDISGYILLTEGFWYNKWGGGHGASKEYIQGWARNWTRAVGIVSEECHKVNPKTEILPWEYNIDFRPQNVETKRYFIQQLPKDTIPLLTWENGKSFTIDGLKGHLRDYAISQVGPAEVTIAQIEEAKKRGMKVYTNGDTFVCGAQFQTVPYNPFPFQWHARYTAMEKYGINGTLESWTTGYSPSLMTEIRSWYCWTDSPPLEQLLSDMASMIFGKENKEKVLKAWDLFSQAVRMVPDTGPTMGTSAAVGNPIFFKEPPLRTTTFHHSWEDQQVWQGYFGSMLNPYWPFTVSRLTFYPDFTNKTNKAESYARSTSGIEAESDIKVLPVFLKYLDLAARKMEEGLALYREAALNSPEKKKNPAIRDVIVAEQLKRMMESEHAILEFESLRLSFIAERERDKSIELIDKLESIIRNEIGRTELSLEAAERDSRLGFQQENDYVYTPYSLREKLGSLHETLKKHLPEARKRI